MICFYQPKSYGTTLSLSESFHIEDIKTKDLGFRRTIQTSGSTIVPFRLKFSALMPGLAIYLAACLLQYAAFERRKHCLCLTDNHIPGGRHTYMDSDPIDYYFK